MEDLFWDVPAPPGAPAPTAGCDPGSLGETRLRNRLREIEDRVNRLSMICCAMWTVVSAHSNVEDEELVRLVQELDLVDGVEDGRARVPEVRDCPQCHRPVSIRHLRCLYCGADPAPGGPFDKVL